MFHMFPSITSHRKEYTTDEVKNDFRRFLSEAAVLARAIKMADNKFWIRPMKYTYCSINSLEQIHDALMKEVNDLADKLSENDIKEMIEAAKKDADALYPLNYQFRAPHFGMWDAAVKRFIEAVERRTNGTLPSLNFNLILYSECALAFLHKRQQQMIKNDVLHQGIIGQYQLPVTDSSSFASWIPMLQNAFAKDDKNLRHVLEDEVMNLVRDTNIPTDFHKALEFAYCFLSRFNEKNPNATREERLAYFKKTLVEYNHDYPAKDNSDFDKLMTAYLELNQSYFEYLKAKKLSESENIYPDTYSLRNKPQ